MRQGRYDIIYRVECPVDEAVAGLGGGCGDSSQRCEYTDNKGDNGESLNHEKLSNAWWRNIDAVEVQPRVAPSTTQKNITSSNKGLSE